MRELRPLTPDRIPDLAGACAPCTFWQTVPNNGHGQRPDAATVLAHWVEEVSAEWSAPGQVVYVDGAPAGHVLLAPARFVPRLAAFATAPSNPRSLVLVTVVTAPGHASLRKLLIHAATKAALSHHARTLDVVAARPLAVARHPCVLEAGPLERAGFRVERDHPAYPRLRLDLRTAITLKDEATAYVTRALRSLPGLRPAPETHPEGVGRVHSFAD